MKYRKKPVIIDAIRFTHFDHAGALPVDVHNFLGREALVSVQAGGLVIHTLEGDMRADKGDWLIRGVKGELYPCKDEIFHLTYEPVTP